MKKNIAKIFLLLCGVVFTQNVSAQASCDTTRNYIVPSNNSYTIYAPNANGILLGSTTISADVTYQIKNWGEPYEATSAQNVRGVRMLPHKITNTSGSATVTVNVHSFDWNTVAPTTLLGSQTISFDDLLDPMYWSTILFDTPVSVTGDYFVSYTVNLGSNLDTFALATTLVNDIYGATMFKLEGAGGDYDNMWMWVDEVYQSAPDVPIAMAFALDVLVSNGTVPTPVITLDDANICEGGSFSPNASASTGSIDTYTWYLTDNTVTTMYATSTEETPTITPPSNFPTSGLLILQVEGACATEFEFEVVNVSSALSATATPTGADCTDNGSILISAVTGGVATSTAEYRLDGGAFQTSNSFTDLASGTYVVEVKKGGNGCTYSESVVVGDLTEDASFNYGVSTICAGGDELDPQSVTTSGGVFSSTTGLIINEDTGTIDVANSDEGTYTITYTTGGACPNSSTQSLTITSAPSAAFTLSSNEVCGSASNVTATVTGSVGEFSSTTGLEINASTGEVNVAASTPGTYVITNTIAASGSCPAATHNETLEIIAASNADFAYSATQFCEEGSNPTITITGTAGTFSSTAGLEINTTTGDLDIAASTVGTYVITNTVAATGVCPEVTSTETIVINALPTATASASGATATVVETTGATYQWINCDDDTEITGATSSTYAPSAPGSFQVVVTANGCSSTSACISVTNVSVSSVSLDNVAIFPNPASDVITIAGLTAAQSTITVLDVNGKVIISQVVTAAQADLTIANVESGVYFIQVSSETLNGTKRFIKK